MKKIYVLSWMNPLFQLEQRFFEKREDAETAKINMAPSAFASVVERDLE